ncbi:MAG TPA: MFS transporter [Bordetella sp.]
MSSRYQLLAVIWITQLVNYMDRVNIAIAGPTIMHSLGISPTSFGFILSAFTLGYLLMQLPGGYLADRFGAKALMIVAPLVWSFFTAMTGMVSSVAGLILVRICFGAAEGSSNSAYYKIVGDNFSFRERAGANAVWFTALALGPALAAPVGTWLLGLVGWRQLFWWFAAAGLVVALIVLVAVPDQRRLTVLQDTETPAAGLGWRALLALIASRPTSWLLFFGFMGFNMGFWAFLGWLPSYLSIERHIDLKGLGVAASIPYFCGFLGLVLFGWLSNRRLYRHRAALLGSAYVVAACALYLASIAGSAAACVAGLSAVALCLYGSFAPWSSLMLDLAPVAGRATMAGFVNVGGQIGGLLAPSIVGYLVQSTHSFASGFACMMACLVIGGLCFYALGWAMIRRPAAGLST